MDETIRAFTDLHAWQESHKLVLAIYDLTKGFPRDELFCLTNQIRRAAVSITSNIAEGFRRNSYKEKTQFYYLAKGSLNEVKNQLFIARDVYYITKTDCEKIMEQADIADRILQGLIRKTRSHF